MSQIKRVLGMAWATPVIRTAVQAGLGAALAVLSSAAVLDSSAAKAAFAAAVAAAVAKLQASARA